MFPVHLDRMRTMSITTHPCCIIITRRPMTCRPPEKSLSLRAEEVTHLCRRDRWVSPHEDFQEVLVRGFMRQVPAKERVLGAAHLSEKGREQKPHLKVF